MCSWFVIWLLYTYPNVHALFSCPLVICLIFYYSSTIHLPQGQYACQDRWWWTLFYFLLSLYFTFLFFFLFNFLFLEQLGLGFISHAVTSITNWWRSHKTDHGTWKNEVEGSGTKWRYTAWTTHAGLMLYSWSFRVGCTVASTDHG